MVRVDVHVLGRLPLMIAVICSVTPATSELCDTPSSIALSFCSRRGWAADPPSGFSANSYGESFFTSSAHLPACTFEPEPDNPEPLLI